jgi:ATP-dependent Clp protease ATP-binding subunit ClpA
VSTISLHQLTDRSVEGLQEARLFANQWGHRFVGTKHLLYGITCKFETGVATTALRNLGVTALDIEKAVNDSFLKGTPEAIVEPLLHLMPDARVALNWATEEARLCGDARVGTEHILLGIINDWLSPGSQVLGRKGLSADLIRTEVLSLLGKIQPLRRHNFNDYITVTLTEAGLKVVQASRRWESSTELDGTKLRTQLWVFMQYFGPLVYIGGPQYFVDNEFETESSE